MSVIIKIDDNTKAVRKALEEQGNTAMYKVGLAWLNNATNQIEEGFGAPIVDTGRLKGSLSFVTTQNAKGNKSVSESKSSDKLRGKAPPLTIYMGSNVSYAEEIENGGANKRARPFLKNSMINYKDQYEEIVKSTLKK